MVPQLGVTDAAGSLAFYCDVLGFKANWVHKVNGVPAVAEVQLGAAKIQFGRHDGVADNADQRKARAATILFFQTNDVAAMRAAVVARGGAPSELSDVAYWMKMRIFEIRDPDGHDLWFGQSL
jgi:uncharacterized glyoxalase superfamily protein PhnB